MRIYADIIKTIGQPSFVESYLSTLLAEQERAEARQLTVSIVSDDYLAKLS